MDAVIEWIYSNEPSSLELLSSWKQFLKEHPSDLHSIKKIDLSGDIPILTDHDGRKLSIDFINNAQNYNKKKGSMKTELISKALGSGRLGHSVLDLSAGLGIDSIFLSQLGYKVTAVERNPVLFLALDTAQKKLSDRQKENLQFEFASAKNFLIFSEKIFDVIYFDPMFPEKKKSALPRQEMVMFRHLVGSDDDAKDVVETAIKLKRAKRVVVKRPIKAPLLLERPQNQVEGKLIRFDVYGVNL
ncbi:MAG: class I SAM-dependent methyltransferase [Bdellovibrio sp.]|nr:class I SAM-dependent methyltransferase [Bdellovibrio sp.]